MIPFDEVAFKMAPAGIMSLLCISTLPQNTSSVTSSLGLLMLSSKLATVTFFPFILIAKFENNAAFDTPGALSPVIVTLSDAGVIWAS